MPAGMELFPPTDDTAWQLIKDVIDASDYYLLIIGGRYGSRDAEGVSFTEKEYDYAVSKKKPVIPLLHGNPDGLPRDKTETDNDAWNKLEKFRKKVEKAHTRVYWSSADELKSKVIVGLTSAFKRHPGIGWVRADNVPENATLKEVLSLKETISRLENELEEKNTSPPTGSEELASGDDEFEIEVSMRVGDENKITPNDDKYTGTFTLAWDDIFASVAPALIHEVKQSDLKTRLGNFIENRALEYFSEEETLKSRYIHSVRIINLMEELDTCLIQLRALGLIRENKSKKRSLRDTSTYWELSPFGDSRMVQLRAIRKSR
ncbi:hypothetical protein CA11_33150 [Gimesia maris]|nr:hypothetical protein CA11_33150 [Gimesia maris]